MKVNTEAFAQKMANINGITKSEAFQALRMVSNTMSTLIDEGCTSFRVSNLFTLSFKKFSASRHYNVNSKKIEMGRPRIKAQILLGKKMRERVRKAFDINKDLV